VALRLPVILECKSAISGQRWQVPFMLTLPGRQAVTRFRWHLDGEFQACPNVRFWEWLLEDHLEVVAILVMSPACFQPYSFAWFSAQARFGADDGITGGGYGVLPCVMRTSSLLERPPQDFLFGGFAQPN
jgi:hypothetical protein